MTFLTDDPIEQQALIDAVMRRSDGALALFAGVVRDHHEGKAVESIFYECWRPMAEKEMAKIAADVAAAYPDAAIAFVHRLGLLQVGEASIVIACASPHRDEAFSACREVIERVKKTVPIWKREKGPDGEEWGGWQGK
jgi:molybdopterin synthase catalytic subunit